MMSNNGHKNFLDPNLSTLPALFGEAWSEMQNLVHDIAVSKGWWETDREDGTLIALAHSELSEALDSMRHGHPPDRDIPEFTNTEVELADTVIRIMDTAAKRGYRVGEAIIAKARFNCGRSHKHGGKAF